MDLPNTVITWKSTLGLSDDQGGEGAEENDGWCTDFLKCHKLIFVLDAQDEPYNHVL